MQCSRRRVGPFAWRVSRHAAVLLALLAALLAAPALAGDATVRGAQMDRFGRIALTFDTPTKVSVRAQNGVLVIALGTRTEIRGERLATEMPSYVAAARLDPDGMGLRVALAQKFRANLLEAGEKVFIDLLPETWSGLPPGLPPDVVAELASRARAAEARAATEESRRRTATRKPVTVRVAELPTLTRLIFEPPGLVPMSSQPVPGGVEIRFGEPLILDPERRPALSGGVSALESEVIDGGLLVRIAVAPGYKPHTFREDEAFVVDLEKPEPPKDEAGKAMESKLAEAKAAAAAEKASKPNPASGAPASTGPVAVEPQAPQTAPGRGSPVPSGENAASKPPAAVKKAAPARAEMTAEGLKLVFPFAAQTPAAAFERGGVVRAVFHTGETVAAPALPEGAGRFARLRDVVREGAFVVVRLDLTEPRLVRMAPQDDAWVLTIGGGAIAASEPLVPRRAIDDSGRTIMTVPLTEVSGIAWLDEAGGGERIAVATAPGPSRSVAKPQKFVEFGLLPTAHGVAVTSAADDVIVRSGMEGVTISRGSGLTLSLPGLEAAGPGATAIEPVIDRTAWTDAQSGAVREKSQEMLIAAATSARSVRSKARLDYARFLLANRMAPEASGVLDVAMQDDPTLSNDRTRAVLKGIALDMMRHGPQARAQLSRPALAEDAEALLWRAVLDAREKRWQMALIGFRRSRAMLDAYPDDLQGEMRLLAMRAALAMRDFSFAERELTLIGQLKPGSVSRDEVEYLRALLDEAAGRTDVAMTSLSHLAQNAERPIAAEASLAFTRLALQETRMSPEEAINRLETLSVIWRGDDTEIGAIGHLGRLYAESGRWREAFSAARKANQIFPDHPITRGLHDETSRLFEDLFLAGKGSSLGRVEALALFFDFKEFLPIGRRGDEIVRRLADRLVELDLLDRAADLLRHQVDNRLYGAARATVAARLATIYLMDARPAEAVEVLRSSRLPELPDGVRRARMLLEARALSDLSRTDLALEAIAEETGPEIERLRADILWSGRRWRDAGEAHEELVGGKWQGGEALSDRDRTDVLRAGIAYSLGNEAIALDRLRAKFMPKMADSADAKTFEFVTSPEGASSRAFRDIARRVTSADTLADFLSEYRKRYPDSAAAPRPPRGPGPGETAAPPATPPAPGAGQSQSAPAEPAPSPQARAAAGVPPG